MNQVLQTLFYLLGRWAGWTKIGLLHLFGCPDLCRPDLEVFGAFRDLGLWAVGVPAELLDGYDCVQGLGFIGASECRNSLLFAFSCAGEGSSPDCRAGGLKLVAEVIASPYLEARGLSKSFISRAIIGVTPFKVLIIFK